MAAARKRKQRDRDQRTFRRSDVKIPKDTYETSGDIEKRLATAGPPVLPTAENAVVMLRRDAIHVAERVFQWRRPKRNMVPRHDVIFDMARALREEKAKLPPITVFPVGRDYYVTDGHHRLAAYDTAGWTGAIAARVFLGSLREAERAALRSNSRDKIPMDKPDKFEAAWRLVQQEYSKDTAKSIADDANVATRTVENMRTARRKLKHMGVTEDDLQAAARQSR